MAVSVQTQTFGGQVLQFYAIIQLLWSNSVLFCQNVVVCDSCETVI